MATDEEADQYILRFVRETFKKATDMGSLTLRQICNEYMKEKNTEALTECEKSSLKSTVMTVFQELTSDTQKVETNLQSIKGKGKSSENGDQTKDMDSGKSEASEQPSSDFELSPKPKANTETRDDLGKSVETEKDLDSDEGLSKPQLRNKTAKRMRNVSDSENDSGPEVSSDEEEKNTETPISSLPRKSKKFKLNDCDIAKPLQDSEDSEEESLAKNQSRSEGPSKESDDSEEESLANIQSRSRKISEDSEEEFLVNIHCKSKKVLDSEDSEEESLARIQHQNRSLKKRRLAEEDQSDHESLDVNIKKKKSKISKKREKQTKKSSQNENKPPLKKTKTEEGSQLKFLKSCCRAAGLFVRYDKIFEDCDTDVEKEKALLNHLKQAGLRGKPNLEGCKRLRLKREEKKALEDLDTANIISVEGRGSRHTTGSATKKSDSTGMDSALSDVKKAYSRLKGIVDSEGSDSE